MKRSEFVRHNIVRSRESYYCPMCSTQLSPNDYDEFWYCDCCDDHFEASEDNSKHYLLDPVC